MSVGTYALTSLDMAKNYLGDRQEANGIWVYCTASGATAATVAVSSTALTLIITGGGSAGTNTLTFSDSDKDTITELVTAINALTGWKAGALYYGDAASTDLIVTGTLSCLGAANELTLRIEANYAIEKLVDRATDIIERWCNRKLRSRTYTREVYWGNGTTRLLLDQYPVSTVSRVSLGRTNAFSVKNTTATNNATIEITSSAFKYSADGAAATSLTLSSYATINLLIDAINAVAGWSATLLNSSLGTRKSTDLLIRPAMSCISPAMAYCEIPNDELTDYHLIAPSEDRNYGQLYYSGGFTQGTEYFVDYTAGYSTVPAALEELCLALIKLKYDRNKKDMTVQSETIGGVWSYNLGDIKQMSTDLLEEASYFRKIVL